MRPEGSRQALLLATAAAILPLVVVRLLDRTVEATVVRHNLAALLLLAGGALAAPLAKRGAEVATRRPERWWAVAVAFIAVCDLVLGGLGLLLANTAIG